jgi:hypothetical protein
MATINQLVRKPRKRKVSKSDVPALQRADAAADFRHVVGLRGQPVSLLHPTLGGQHQPVRDVVVKRAVDLAERHTTLRAAARLVLGSGDIELVIDLVEILNTCLGTALVRHFLVGGDEFQHLARHGCAPLSCPVMPRRKLLGAEKNDASTPASPVRGNPRNGTASKSQH